MGPEPGSIPDMLLIQDTWDILPGDRVFLITEFRRRKKRILLSQTESFQAFFHGILPIAHSEGMAGIAFFISVQAAWSLSRSIRHVTDINEIYSDCDYITIHVPLSNDTRGMIGKDAISRMKEGVVLLNFARDALVDEEAIIEGLKSGKVKKYVTDFVTPAVAHAKNTLVTPHLGASTMESEENCAEMAVNEIVDYLENGNIKNSVNYPACDVGVCTSVGRVAITHKNIPNMLSRFTGVLGNAGINISYLTNKSRGAYAYSIIDTNDTLNEDVVEGLNQVDGVFKVRVIK